MAFHTAVWVDNYFDYIAFLSNLEQFSSPNDYTLLEYYDLRKGSEEKVSAQIETGNMLPGTKDDINLMGYILIQFDWGKKINTFYRHPSDDFKCGKATKNTMGR
jgi:hypothetical protein